MKIIPLLPAVALLALATASGDAHAQNRSVAGRYDVSVEKVVDSCRQGAIELDAQSVLTVTTDVKDISMKFAQTPDLRGPLRSRGRFKATGKSRADKGASIGNFSATGRANNGSIRLVLVAEFYKDGKAQCTQSWNISGKRQ